MELGDTDDADDLPVFRQPPPPDDRLWRHPSELAWVPALPRGRFSWTLAVVSGLTGAVLTLGLLAATGVLGEHGEVPQLVGRVGREAGRSAVAMSMGATDADLAEIARDVAPAIVRLEFRGSDERVGSGVLFRSDGDVLTTAHLVDGTGSLRAVLADGRSFTAHVVGLDAETDIAVVKLDGAGAFPTALLGTADGMTLGQPAIALGAPDDSSKIAAVTIGVVSGMGREMATDDGPVLVDLIQTDAAIPSRSYGGALLDHTGAVVGITTTLAEDHLGAEGLGFAIPVDVARAVADDLLLFGHVRSVWVGVRGETPGKGAGVTIAALMDASPASAAGLLVGDIVRRIDGRPVGSMSAVRIALRRRHPGDHVAVVYDRNGTRHTADLVLAERPAA